MSSTPRNGGAAVVVGDECRRGSRRGSPRGPRDDPPRAASLQAHSPCSRMLPPQLPRRRSPRLSYGTKRSRGRSNPCGRPRSPGASNARRGRDHGEPWSRPAGGVEWWREAFGKASPGSPSGSIAEAVAATLELCRLEDVIGRVQMFGPRDRTSGYRCRFRPARRSGSPRTGSRSWHRRGEELVLVELDFHRAVRVSSARQAGTAVVEQEPARSRRCS